MKLLTLAGLAMLVSGSAFAGGLECGDTAAVLKRLHDKYGETPVMTGITVTGSPAIVTLSPGGSWTLLMATADHKLCYIAAGKTMGRAA